MVNYTPNDEWAHDGGQWIDYGTMGAIKDGYRVRVRVHLDTSHPTQSRAHLDVWHMDTLAWNEAVTIFATKINPMIGTIPDKYDRNLKDRAETYNAALIAAFHAVRDHLIDQAGWLLFPC